MLKSCKYCGKIHDSKINCEKRPVRGRVIRYDPAAAFRRSGAWKKKSIQIMERDKFLCQLCLRNYPGTVNRFNSVGLSVHHNVPLSEDKSLGLDDSNLITLCLYHHRHADMGTIPREYIHSIIDEQNAGYTPPGGIV